MRSPLPERYIMSNETVIPIVITDAPESPVPFYKNRRILKAAAAVTAVTAVVALVTSRVKSNNNEDPAGDYVDVETTPAA